MRRHLDLGLPVLAVAFVVVAALLPTSTTTRAEPQQIGIVESSYACPAGGPLTLAAGQLKPGQERTVRTSPESDDDLGDATDPSAWSVFEAAAAGVIVTETGREAGAEGFYGGRGSAANGGGLVVGRCGGVVEDGWFLGLGSADRRDSTVVLSNLSASPAIADLTLWGPKGEIDAIDATGIALDPWEVRRVRVADLAAGEPLIGLRVERRRGVVGAVVTDSSTATFAGTEPLEQTLAPTRSQVLPGLAGGARGRTLFLLNPGDTAARVDVQIVGGEGPFVDPELQGLKVDAGSMLQVEVPTSARAGRQAYRITSDEPVAASARVAPSTDDYVHLETSEPLDGPALVPVDLGPGVGAPRLVLTSASASAGVTLIAYDEAMTEIRRSEVDVEDDTTQVVDTADVAEDAAYLVVEPRGSITGTATYVTGARVSSLLLRPVPATIDAPAVTPAE